MKSALPPPLRRVILALCEDVRTEFSSEVAKAIKDEDYVKLVSMRAEPTKYTDAISYKKDNVISSLLRKCEDLPTGLDPNAAALETWLESERACYRTNVRMKVHINEGPFEDVRDMRVHEFMLRVKKTFRKLLGPVPQVIREPKLGPGSTFNDKGLLATVPDKFTSRPTISTKARMLLPFWEESYWARNLCAEFPNRSDPENIDVERIVYVPKDATTSRTISIGPSINIYLQLGVARHIRWRLEKAGICLETGQPLHELYARVGSILDCFATIDLKSASDSIASELVRFLCTEDWYELLNGLRMERSLMKDGSTHHLQKFSAMGNGYTFELETLIFLSAAVTLLQEKGLEAKPGVDCLVYGDDIIVPSECSEDLLPVLKYMGFRTNVRKTFVSGPFRESCGGDFFSGVPVRAHYLEEYPTQPSEWISLANGIRRACTDEDGTWLLGLKAWHRCLDQIPWEIRRLRVPSGLGDLGINDDVTTLLPHGGGTSRDYGSRDRNDLVVCTDGIRYFRVWRPFARTIPMYHWKPGVQLASALYGVPSDGPIPRSRGEEVVGGFLFDYVPYS